MILRSSRGWVVLILATLAFGLTSSSVVSEVGASGVSPNYYYCYWPYYYYYCYGYGYYYGYYYHGYGYGYGYQIQYDLNVQTNPTGVTTTTGAGKYNQGTSATFSVAQIIIAQGDGARLVFTHWSGDYSGNSPAATVLMDRSKTIVANFRMEYYLKVDSEPAVSAATGQGWYPAGSSASPSAVPQVIEVNQGSRYVLTSWKLDGLPVGGNPPMLTMNGPHTLTAAYKQQFYLKIVSPHGSPYGEGWYDAGSTAVITIASPIDVSYGVSLVFNRWEGDFVSDSATSSVKIDAPKTVVAAWRQDRTVLNASIGGGVAAIALVGVGVGAVVVRGRRQQMQAPRLSGQRPPKRKTVSEEELAAQTSV